jgi:DNA-directed RNA polymerase specialized sigma24 family protein
MGYAARVMRGLIIDHARNRQAQKRGGKFEIATLGNAVEAGLADDTELSRVSDTLDKLAKVAEELAEVVDLKFFCGFSFAEIATMKSSRNARCRGSGKRPVSTCIGSCEPICEVLP